MAALELFERMSLVEKLNDRIRACSHCKSIEIPCRAVPFEGDALSEVLVVGRNPGYHELNENRPFVGPGGKCLDKFLDRLGRPRNVVMIANMICCYTTKDRPPTDQEIDYCCSFVKELIGIMQPKIILALGKQALQMLVNTHDSPAITHGTVYDSVFKTPHGVVETKVFASWHPGSALRSGKVLAEFMEDATKLSDWLEEAYVGSGCS